jgi:hypothetical protein
MTSEQHKKIFIFFESHTDPLPAKTMRQLLPFFKSQNVKTFCAEQPTTETKDETIEKFLSMDYKVKELMKPGVKLNDEAKAIIEYYDTHSLAHKEYVDFLRSLSKYQIKFRGVDMPYRSFVEQIKARAERDQFMVDRIIELKANPLLLVGINHADVACKLILQGYQVHAYYTPSISAKSELSIVDNIIDRNVRPKDKQHTEIFKVKMECDEKDFFILKVIDISLNKELNTTKMIIEDYCLQHNQECELNADSFMSHLGEL